MWIRSQDKKTLAYCTRLTVVGRTIQNLPATGIEDDYDVLGRYETPERAIEVLSEIQEQLFRQVEIQEEWNSYQKIKRYFIYEMPKE